MAAPTAPSTAPLGDVVRWRARAEWFEIDSLLGYRDAEMARTAHVEPARRRQVERSAIALTIAEATHLSEGQVQLRLSAADRVREQAPTVWEAFADGVVDWSRVRDIASTIDQLEREESITRLDCLVVPYAACHTGAELRQWLRRFVHRVEADLASPRADTARRDRHVSIRHGDDAMSWLNAYLPSHEAAAIEQRLRAEARRPVDDADDRTIAQREADVLVGWCLDEDASTGSTGTTGTTASLDGRRRQREHRRDDRRRRASRGPGRLRRVGRRSLGRPGRLDLRCRRHRQHLLAPHPHPAGHRRRAQPRVPRSVRP